MPVCYWLTVLSGISSAQNADELGWEVRERQGRIFYFTRGTAVWGHEFGFFKDPDDCAGDTFWLVFSSDDERVKDFKIVHAAFIVTVDGRDFRVSLPLLGGTTVGTTQVMSFTNIELPPALMNALKNGKTVSVKIEGPGEFEQYFDIKEDEFTLDGFNEHQTEARRLCEERAPAVEKELVRAPGHTP